MPLRKDEEIITYDQFLADAELALVKKTQKIYKPRKNNGALIKSKDKVHKAIKNLSKMESNEVSSSSRLSTAKCKQNKKHHNKSTKATTNYFPITPPSNPPVENADPIEEAIFNADEYHYTRSGCGENCVLYYVNLNGRSLPVCNILSHNIIQLPLTSVEASTLPKNFVKELERITGTTLRNNNEGEEMQLEMKSICCCASGFILSHEYENNLNSNIMTEVVESPTDHFIIPNDVEIVQIPERSTFATDHACLKQSFNTSSQNGPTLNCNKISNAQSTKYDQNNVIVVPSQSLDQNDTSYPVDIVPQQLPCPIQQFSVQDNSMLIPNNQAAFQMGPPLSDNLNRMPAVVAEVQHTHSGVQHDCQYPMQSNNSTHLPNVQPISLSDQRMHPNIQYPNLYAVAPKTNRTVLRHQTVQEDNSIIMRDRIYSLHQRTNTSSCQNNQGYTSNHQVVHIVNQQPQPMEQPKNNPFNMTHEFYQKAQPTIHEHFLQQEQPFPNFDQPFQQEQQPQHFQQQQPRVSQTTIAGQSNHFVPNDTFPQQQQSTFQQQPRIPQTSVAGQSNHCNHNDHLPQQQQLNPFYQQSQPMHQIKNNSFNNSMQESITHEPFYQNPQQIQQEQPFSYFQQQDHPLQQQHQAPFQQQPRVLQMTIARQSNQFFSNDHLPQQQQSTFQQKPRIPQMTSTGQSNQFFSNDIFLQ